MRGDTDVVVVGSGPNGLAAAVTCAAAGLSVTVVEAESGPGGGCRTQCVDLSVPLLHDLCSAVHPMAMASPFFQQFDLPTRGVQFGLPEISFAHPLVDGPAAIAYRGLERTVAELGEHGGQNARLYRRVMAPLVEGAETVRDIGLSDVRSIPVSALRPHGAATAVTLAARALQLGTAAWDRTTDAKACGALLTGIAAHANTTIPSLAGTSVSTEPEQCILAELARRWSRRRGTPLPGSTATHR